jgi:hypothetical protein
MRRRAILVVPEGQCPHPRRTDRRRSSFHDAANNNAVGKHVVVVVIAFAGRATCRRSLENQIVFFHFCGAATA